MRADRMREMWAKTKRGRMTERALSQCRTDGDRKRKAPFSIHTSPSTPFVASPPSCSPKPLILLLLRLLYLLPPHVSSPCILILPIIPTSQFGQPFASVASATHVGRVKGKENEQENENRRDRTRKRKASRLLSIGLSFRPRLLIGILLWREEERTSMGESFSTAQRGALPLKGLILVIFPSEM